MAYIAKLNAEFAMALMAFWLVTVIFLTQRVWQSGGAEATSWVSRFGPEQFYTEGLHYLNRTSDKIHWIKVRDLRSRVATVLLPAALLVGLALIFSDVVEVLTLGTVSSGGLPEALMMAVVALAAITAAVPRDHFSMALALSGVGIGLAVMYSLLNAPDVAMVAVLIETIFALLIFGFLALLPREVDHADVVPTDEDERIRIGCGMRCWP